ncbi:MAG: glycerol-3-phosphate 1-O-acyltransferase PlsY [Clostridia bacterium]|nr:glycerol-3-phosphate 1-O-acyltransferase PlsY [Clostridia bacterium]
MLKILLTVVISYLLGSCATGIIYSRMSGNGDIRTKGSKNSGATNMLRVLGKKAALITLLGDILKGSLAAFIGKWLVGGTLGGMIGALFAVLGHNYPVFFGFKGGKGIATSLGSLLVVLPVPSLIAFAVFVVTVSLTRYVSLGSILAAITVPVAYLFTMPFELPVFLICLLMAFLAIYRHRANIGRLRRHEENKISFSK